MAAPGDAISAPGIPLLLSSPLISVVLPVYNGSPYLAEAIESILTQTHKHLELIVIDDGSTDGSAEIILESAARDSRVRPHFRGNGGIGRATNAGIALAQGEFIAPMDQDDISLPERLAIQLAYMLRTGVDVCGSYAKQFGAKNNLLWFPESHEALCHELLFRIALLNPAVMMRAEVAKAHPYDETLTQCDYELWTRLALKARLGTVPQVLFKYRRHAGQTHVTRAAQCNNDVRTARQRYFHTLFPDASGEDYSAVAGAAEKARFTDLAELERAGVWLVRLAQTPDAFLRRRMLGRWMACCRRAALARPDKYRVYREFATQFGIPRTRNGGR